MFGRYFISGTVFSLSDSPSREGGANFTREEEDLTFADMDVVLALSLYFSESSRNLTYLFFFGKVLT